MGIDALKPKEKRYTVSDGNCLYLEVHSNGNKFWRLRFKDKGRLYNVSLGRYPDMGVKDARINAVTKKNEMCNVMPKSQKTFRYYAERWLSMRVAPTRALTTKETIVSRLNIHIYPHVGDKPISEVTPQDILSLAKKLETAEKTATARRCAGIIGQVIRFAISDGEQLVDPSPSLWGNLVPYSPVHFSSITTKREAGELMRKVAEYPSMLTRNALLFTAYTFCRQGEIRFATWDEFDLEDKIWRLPPERMKARKTHLVPLSDQVMAILKKMSVITDADSYVFPSQRDFRKPMSENCSLQAVRRMGYTKEQMTPHGFRSLASTLLNESRLWSVDAIELQLAHTENDSVRKAYNYAQLMDERIAMVQWYANFLDSLRDASRARARSF